MQTEEELTGVLEEIDILSTGFNKKTNNYDKTKVLTIVHGRQLDSVCDNLKSIITFTK